MTADPDPDADAARPRLNLGLLQTLATVALVVFMLSAARVVLIPIALAVLFVFILSPVVRLVERTGLTRTPAVLLTLLLAAGVIGGVGYIISGQVLSLAQELPKNKANIQRKINELRGTGGPLSELFAMVDQLVKDEEPEPIPPPAAAAPGTVVPVPVPAPDQTSERRSAGVFGQKQEVIVKQAPKSGIGAVVDSVLPIVEPIANLALVGVLIIFFLVNREDMRNRVISLFGRGQVTGTTRVLSDAAERVSKFLLFQLVVNAGFGVVLAVGLYFIGVKYAVLWGFLSALLRFIPYIGTWISALFPFAISFATADGWAQPLTVFAFFAVLDLVTANVVEPLLFGHQTGVSPVAILVAAAFWAWLWGPIGLLLATPITVCLAVIGAHVPKLRPIALLIGDQPALAPHVAFYQRLLAKDKLEAATLVVPAAADAATPHAVLSVYDTVAIPALGLVRRDKQSDGISGEEELAMYDTTAEIVAAAVALKEPATDDDRKAFEQRQAETAGFPAIIGAPAHHRAEELALQMLAAGLPPVGRRMITLSSRQLPVEVEQAIAEANPAAVVIAVIPPGGVPQAVYLVKRLRAKFPDLSIVVGYLGKSRRFDDLLVKFRQAGATYVTTSLVQTADTVKAVAAGDAPPPTAGKAKLVGA